MGSKRTKRYIKEFERDAREPLRAVPGPGSSSISTERMSKGSGV
ncbi:hypothetical protein ACIRPQ_25235 [Streptomyces sp. NPDC101213]